MSDESYLLDNKTKTKEKNWFARILKIIFIISACVLVGITVLYNMGGSNDSLKGSVASFISNVFQGRPVEVNNLVYMGFFPKMGFNAEDIKVLSSPEKGYEIASIGKIQFFMGFWDVAFRNPRISYLYLENFHSIKGAVGPQEFYIEKIFIDHDVENKTAALKGKGKVGINPWSFKINIDVLEAQDFWRTKGNYSYMLPHEFPFVFDIADINIKGNFLNHESGYYKLKDFKITSGNQEVSGNLVLSALGKKMLKLKGDIKKSPDYESVNLDLILDFKQSLTKISGAVSSDNTISSDLIARSDIALLYTKLLGFLGYDKKSGNMVSYEWDIEYKNRQDQ